MARGQAAQACTWIVVPDLHVPFHDIAYVRLVTKIISMVKPHGLIQLGDAVDFFQISTFDKDPDRKNTVYEDLLMYRAIMSEWRAAAGGKLVVHQLEGNHEDRLRRFVWRSAPQLKAMIRSVPEVLDLMTPGNYWHGYHDWQSCKIGDVLIHHGAYFNKHVAMGNLGKYPAKFICGHTHRFQYVSDGAKWSCTMGHGSLAEETSHMPAPTEWQQVVSLLTVVSGVGTLEPILVNNGKCVLRGEVLAA